MTDCPCQLAGLQVLVTRPLPQAHSLAAALAACGAKTLLLPTIEIKAADDLAAQVAGLSDYDDLIFASVNAVELLLQTARPQSHQRLIAIGTATAQALAAHGLTVALCPPQADSETLLQEPQLADMTNRRVLILRGQDGRDLMATRLTERGAQVDYANLYTRLCPTTDCTELLAEWSTRVEVITTTSNQVLDHLLQLCGASPVVLQTPILVVSERGAAHAAAAGFHHILQAQGAANNAIIDCLCASFG